MQLTDVDPPYGKAPTAQLAEKLPETGRAGEVFENTREMLLETQVCWADTVMVTDAWFGVLCLSVRCLCMDTLMPA